MKPEDIKKAPKLFCESIHLAYTPEYFVMGLSSGEQSSIYSITPQHAKRLQQYLSHQVSEFESKNGEIKQNGILRSLVPFNPNRNQQVRFDIDK